ncbi:MAG: ParB/RepB/Spo0J family partition protein [Phycisphaerales bacterium]|nr:ParB/RepB/Spo0J family partition protein [Phycisphaerales bacterium]
MAAKGSQSRSVAGESGGGVAPTAAPAKSAGSAPIGAAAAPSPYIVLQTGEVTANRFQPRQDFDEPALAALAASIKRDGMMQPLVVRKVKSGGAKATPVGDAVPPAGAQWELIAGERRWRAAMIAGLSRVPAVVVEIDDVTAALWAVVENVQRVDLSALDKSAAYARLSKEFGLTQQQIAEQVGEDRTLVSHYIRLGELEPAVIELLRTGKLTFGHAKTLNSPLVKAGEVRVKLAERAARETLSVRQLEQLVQRGAGEKLEYVESTAWTPQYVKGHDDAQFNEYEKAELTAQAQEKQWDAESAAAARAKAFENRANVRDLEEQIGKHLGTKVKIKTSGAGKRGVISLEYYSLDHFDGLVAKMGIKRQS